MAEKTENQEFVFTEAELKEVQHHLAKYPDARSAVMPVLWMAQNKYGWLSEGAIGLVSETLGLAYAQVYGVATFYTQYFKREVPKYVFDICTCFACGELGGQEIYEYAKEYLECNQDGYSKDNLFYIRHAECLGACDTGPMAQVSNRHYAHNLTKEGMKKLIDDLRNDHKLSFVSIPLSDQTKIGSGN